MENYKGKSIPIVNDFGINGPWIPFTPLNPHLGPINENGDVGNYLSAFSQQNNHAQTLLSYSGTPPSINNGISSIPSSSSNTNHHQHLWYDDGGRLMQRRGLEYYLPAWNSQGRRTNEAYPWTNPTAAAAQGSYISDYPYLSSWESSMPWTQNGIGDGTFAAASASAAAMEQFETMSYTGLLCSNDISGLGLGMGNEAVYQGWDYNQYLGGYNTDVYGNPIYNPIFQGEMQSCASPHQYQSVYDANSSQDTKHANGNYSNFAPATPDSRWRIDSNEAPGNSPFGTYQRSTEQNGLPEQVKQVAAAVMINVHNVQEGVTIPNTQESSTGKVSMTVENHNPLETATEGEQTPAGATEAGVSTPTGETEARDSKQSGLVAKSCRKSLNFDLNGQAESNFPHMPNGYLHVVPQPNMCDTTLRMGQELMVETSRVCTAYELNYTQHQELKKYLSLPTKDYQNNTQPDLINLSKEIDEGHHSLLGNNTEVSSRNEAHLAQSPNSSPCASSNEQKISRGSKRRNYCMADIAAGSVDAANHCTFWQPNHSNFGNATTGELHTFLFPEIFKKKRTEKVQRPHIPSMPFTTATSEDINLVADTQNHSRVYPTTSKYYCNPASYSNNAVSHNHAELLMGSVENTVQPLDSWTDMAKLKKKKRSKGTTRVSDLAPLRGKPGPKGPRKKTSNTSEHASTEALEVDSTPKPRSKRESRKQNSSNKRDLILYDANQPSAILIKLVSNKKRLLHTGDRRFTPWKGSVLDSVIGVFLTQNVADHLSR